MQCKHSAQLIQPPLRHFPASSSVRHSEGTGPPWRIMYALIDLTETENVVFRSGALRTHWLSVTRLVRQLQSRATGLDEWKSWGGLQSGCECVCLCWWGGSSSWEQCWREVKSNWLTNYRCPFWLCLYVSHCSAWMREQSPGTSNETLHFVGSALRHPIRNNWLPSESSQGGVFMQQFKGMKFWVLSFWHFHLYLWRVSLKHPLI